MVRMLCLAASTRRRIGIGGNEQPGIDVVDGGLRVLGASARRCSRSRSVSRVVSARAEATCTSGTGLVGSAAMAWRPVMMTFSVLLAWAYRFMARM